MIMASASACVNHSPASPPHLPLPQSDFEFSLHHPVAMLPADQLFSQGILLPHHSIPPPLAPSPRAPRWRVLLRLKKLHHHPSPSSPTSTASALRSLKHFLHRSTKSTASSSSDSSPLLKHSQSLDLSISASSRLSLSSSSSSSSQAHERQDLPRLSLDSDRTRPPRLRSLRPRSDCHLHCLDTNCTCTINGRCRNDARPAAACNRAGRSPIRKAEAVSVTAAHGTVTQPDAAAKRGASVDSPRMNSSGRVVFQSLERSSSSPNSFNGGSQRSKHRGVERSYSAGVRITPVLNVPICTLRGSSGGSKSGSGVFGLGQLFISSPRKKENGNGGSNVGKGQRNINGKTSKG